MKQQTTDRGVSVSFLLPLTHSQANLTLFLENILMNGAPREKDWWTKTKYWDDNDDIEVDVVKESEPGTPRFRNRGYETWIQVRKHWRDHSHVSSPRAAAAKSTSRPAPQIRRSLMKQLTNSRQMALPRQIPLKDIVTAYHGIWYEDSD